jgi:hypothetical protein
MIDQYPSANGVLTSLIWRKTAAGGETSLSGYDNASQALSYTPGQEQVYLNGILLVRGDDYTATNGTSITGLAALAADDFIQINCYNNFSVASVPAASLTGTVTNAQLQNSAITINGNAVSLGGSVSLPGDIESVTAGTGLSGGGTSGALTLTNSMATEITAKGDLIVGTGNAAFDNLPVGTNGHILTADSSVSPTGLKWVAPAASTLAVAEIATGSLSGTSITLSSLSNYDYLILHIYYAKWDTSNDRMRFFINNNSTGITGVQQSWIGKSALDNEIIRMTIPSQIGDIDGGFSGSAQDRTSANNNRILVLRNCKDGFTEFQYSSGYLSNIGSGYQTLNWQQGIKAVDEAVSSIVFKTTNSYNLTDGTYYVYGA